MTPTQIKSLPLFTAVMIASGILRMDAASKPEIIGLTGSSNHYISSSKIKIIGKHINQVIKIDSIIKIIILENNTQITDEYQLKYLFNTIEKGPTIEPLWKKSSNGEITSSMPSGKNVSFAIILITDDQQYFKIQILGHYARITTQSEIGFFPSAD